MSRGDRVLGLYAAALGLYPRSFRERYAASMLDGARQWQQDSDLSSLRFAARLARDLVQSLAKEHALMLREKMARNPLQWFALWMGVALTALMVLFYIHVFNTLRGEANYPQAEMVQRDARLLEQGSAVEAVVSPIRVDLQRSLEPFTIVYDDAGNVVASSAELHGDPPTPPRGVFDYVRQHGSDYITWQPQPGVRIASVTRRIGGQHPGFILAGRSLRTTETHEDILDRVTLIGWLGLMALLYGSALFFARLRPAS